jgi:SAM-dependent methyltransferase
MLEVARERLARFPRIELTEADFVSSDLCECDAVVACLSLHHVATPGEKRALYARCRRALRPSGILVSAECFPATERRLADRHREAWLAHLETSYSRSEAEAHLSAWAEEDVYFALDAELGWLREAGFHPEVLWRREGFAVVAAFAGVQ